MVACNSSGHCVYSPFLIHNSPTTSNSSSCHATSINMGFTDFTVHPVDCGAPHQVAIYCEHQSSIEIAKTLQNNLSDVRLSQISNNGYRKLSHFHSCEIGWFRVSDLCLRFFRFCEDRGYWFLCYKRTYTLSEATDKNSEHYKYITGVCEKHDSTMAYHLFSDMTLDCATSLADEVTECSMSDDSELSQFFKPFQRKTRTLNDDTHSPFGISIDSSLLPFNNLYLLVSPLRYRQTHGEEEEESYYIWSLGRNVEFTNQKDLDVAYVLCERRLEESSSVAVDMTCLEYYNQCEDGTCIHDGLWCDGFQHCPHGEDERNCQHICSLQNINCITDCHIEDHCECIDTYFQCLSGGCVPLLKICDGIQDCKDESDEPLTCINRGESSVKTHVKQLLNNLENQHQSEKCYNSFVYSFVGEFQLNQRKVSQCPKQTRSKNDMEASYGLCVDTTQDKRHADYEFLLHKLCIHDKECDKVCSDKEDADAFFHLLNCEHIFCVGHFKCPFSYCISFDQVCDGVCQCRECEDEGFCEKLLCPGLLLAQRFTKQRRRLLYCSTETITLKTKLNRGQVVRTSSLSLTNDYPVYVKLHNQNTFNIFKFSVHWYPELVTHFIIINSQISFVEMDISNKIIMVSMKVLTMTENKLTNIPLNALSSMTALETLNISHNNIKQLPDLCPLRNLKYLFAENNRITGIKQSVFQFNINLLMIVIHSNNLLFVATELNIPSQLIDSLQYLSSDLAKFCCIFVHTEKCSPDLPPYMSCSNLIASKHQSVVAWVFSVCTLLLDLTSAVCLFVVLWRKYAAVGKLEVPLVITLNLSLAEMVISACLFCYPVLNTYYDGEFGVISDQWRYSWKCLGLELCFFVATQACLWSSVIMSLHFAIVIPSIVPRNIAGFKIILILTVMWLLVLGTASAITATKVLMNAMDPLNYFCLPFLISFPSNILIKVYHITLIIIDCGLILCTIVSYTYLFIYLNKQIGKKSLQAVKKRTEALKKSAIRMAIVILTNCLTWTPVLIQQLIVLSGVDINSQVIMWILLSCLPVNLLMDPIFVIKNTLS